MVLEARAQDFFGVTGLFANRTSIIVVIPAAFSASLIARERSWTKDRPWY